MFPKWTDWDITYTSKGQLKQTLRQGFKVAAFVAFVVAAYRTRQAGGSIKGLPGLARDHVRSILTTALGFLGRGIGELQKRI